MSIAPRIGSVSVIHADSPLPVRFKPFMLNGVVYQLSTMARRPESGLPSEAFVVGEVDGDGVAIIAPMPATAAGSIHLMR